jgi:hypothetical protein
VRTSHRRTAVRATWSPAAEDREGEEEASQTKPNPRGRTVRVRPRDVVAVSCVVCYCVVDMKRGGRGCLDAVVAGLWGVTGLWGRGKPVGRGWEAGTGLREGRSHNQNDGQLSLPIQSLLPSDRNRWQFFIYINIYGKMYYFAVKNVYILAKRMYTSTYSVHINILCTYQQGFTGNWRISFFQL